MSDTQFFGSGKSKSWQYQEDSHPLAAKGHWKKNELNGAKSGQKKIVLMAQILYILISWAKCMPSDFELHQGLSCVFTNCQTYLDVKFW